MMMQIVPMSGEELAVLYRLFLANEKLTVLTVRRDSFSESYVELSGENISLYYPHAPLDVKTATINVTLTDEKTGETVRQSDWQATPGNKRPKKKVYVKRGMPI